MSVYEGYLLKESLHLKKFRKRWVILKGEVLYCYKGGHKSDCTEKINLKQYADVKQCADVKQYFEFEICYNQKGKKNKRRFRAESISDMNSWIKYIKKAINITKLYNNQANNVYENLVNMGFSNQLSLIASQQYPENINKAISFITNQSTDNSEKKDIEAAKNCYESKINNNLVCQCIEECYSLKRIINTLKLYQITDINNKENQNKLLLHLQKKHKNFVNDFHHICEYHLNEDNISTFKTNDNFEKIYKQMTNNNNNLKCIYETQQCPIYLRNCRIREKRQNPMMYIDIIDAMHCYFIHSFDVGYRIKYNEIRLILDTEDDSKNTNFYDFEMVRLKSFLSTKRQKLNHIYTSKRTKTHKFNTDLDIQTINTVKNANDMMGKSEHKKLDLDNKSDDKDYTNYEQYIFGGQWDYWDKTSSTYVEWKYCTLKAELTNNNIFCIDVAIFDETYKKAEYLLNNSDKIKTIKSIKEAHCQVRENSRLRIENILAIKFYTDFDMLSYNFSKSWRSLPIRARFYQLKKKMVELKEFRNWSKILIETVNCYGISMNESKISIFYHGTNGVYFDRFSAQFNSPTSTTTKLQIATIFATNNGVILELKKRSHDLRYFNCTFISDFSNEEERLFISPIHQSYYLEFNSIRNMSTDENYKNFVNILVKFESIVHTNSNAFHRFNISAWTSNDILKISNLMLCAENKYRPKTSNNNQLSTMYDQIITNLISSTQNDDTFVSNLKGKFPNYILNCFKNMLLNKTELCINLDILNYMDSFGDVCSKKDENFKIASVDKLIMIFKNVKIIRCYNTGLINSLYLSNLVGMLDQSSVTTAFSSSKLRSIELRNIINETGSLKSNNTIPSKQIESDWYNYFIEKDEFKQAMIRIDCMRQSPYVSDNDIHSLSNLNLNLNSFC